MSQFIQILSFCPSLSIFAPFLHPRLSLSLIHKPQKYFCFIRIPISESKKPEQKHKNDIEKHKHWPKNEVNRKRNKSAGITIDNIKLILFLAWNEYPNFIFPSQSKIIVHKNGNIATDSY